MSALDIHWLRLLLDDIYSNLYIYASMNISDMRAAAQQAANLMKALSSENRLMMLCQLADGEKSVGALAQSLGIQQAAVSQQLALLRRKGLVAPRRDGQTIYYSLAGDAARRVIMVLYELYCAPQSDESHAILETEDAVL